MLATLTLLLWLAFFMEFRLFESNNDEYQESVLHGLDRNLECFYRYSKRDHHQSFAEWLHRKNTSHYTPIAPLHQQSLINLELDSLKDGEQVTHGILDCLAPKLFAITPDTPLKERALCYFEYFLNYNPQRIPAALTEVRCTCSHPSPHVIGRRIFECEPLQYQIRVLKFDELCQIYSEQIETIALACIPVLQASAKADGEMKYVAPEKFRGPIKKRIQNELKSYIF